MSWIFCVFAICLAILSYLLCCRSRPLSYTWSTLVFCVLLLCQYLLSFLVLCCLSFLNFCTLVFCVYFMFQYLVFLSCVFFLCLSLSVARVSPRSGSGQHAATHLGKHRSDRAGLPCTATTYTYVMCIRAYYSMCTSYICLAGLRKAPGNRVNRATPCFDPRAPTSPTQKYICGNFKGFWKVF